MAERLLTFLRESARAGSGLRMGNRVGRSVAPSMLMGVLICLCAVRTSGFFENATLSGLVAEAAPLVLSTLAITPVALSIPAGIDLAIGPLVVLVNVCVVTWLIGHGVESPFEVIPFAIGLGVAFELVQGVVIAVLRLQPVIVTLSGYLVLGGLNLVILPQAGGTVPGWLSRLGSPISILSTTTYVLLGCFAVWYLLGRTALLRNFRLVGGNERAAYASGMNITAIRLCAHVLDGAFAGVAGVFLTALLRSANPIGGSSETLMVVTALVVGGVSLAGGEGGAFRALVGSLDIFLIGFLLGTFQLGAASSYVEEAAYGAILIIMLFLTNRVDIPAMLRRRRGGRPAVQS